MRKDVFEYFKTLQKQQNEMTKILEKVNKELENGECTQENRDNFEKYFNTVTSNYNRVAYLVHLMTLPPKFIQKIQERKLIKEQKRFEKQFQNADLNAVVLENNEAIENMKKLSEDIENGH